MSVLDRDIPYRNVLMVIPKRRVEKEIPLKKGYSYVPYEDALFEPWCQLQTACNLFDSLEEAKRCLSRFLEEDRAFFEDNFLFVVDEERTLVASAGLWPGHHFEEERLRVHYVAVLEQAQHQGIARAMLSKLCVHYDSIPSRYPLYLATQSQSYAAIFMYSRLGFTPYLGAYKEHTKEESEADWEFVTEILKEKSYSA